MTDSSQQHHSVPNPETLRAALEDADLRALLLTVYQLTGESEWLDLKPRRDTRILAPEDAGLPPAEQDRLRNRAFELLRGGARDPVVAAPDEPTMLKLMGLALGEAVPPEYAPMMREELGFAARQFDWPGADPAAKPSVLIVGAGVNGLLLGAQLKRLKVPFQIVEKNPEVGGTWFENRYPGCGVDTPNHAYSFSFTEPFPWQRYFSTRDQIFAYLQRCADEFGVREHIRFNTCVERCDWQAQERQWQVAVTSGSRRQLLRADHLVSAIGHFNAPAIPELPGLDSFQGPVVHTARWPDGLDLRGKRVTVVGSGASAMQVVSAIADDVEALTIFQRTPQWARPIPRCREQISAGAQWLLAQVPLYARWFRFLMFWRYGDGLLPFLEQDPDWPEPERSVNRVNEKHRREMEAYIAEQLAGREDLIQACTPSYPPYAKRMLIDFGWYRALRLPHVELVPHAVTAVTPDAVVADNREHAADVVILATGFDMTSMAARLNVTGRSGRTLAERWAPDNPSAYLGMHVPEFPNFTMLLGPSNGLGHGGSAMFIAECQARYFCRLLIEQMEQGRETIEVTAEAYDQFVTDVDAAHEKLIWKHPGVETYYRNASGRVFSVLPWRLVDFWSMTREVRWTDYLAVR